MLQVKETFVNETKGYQFGDVPWYEPYTDNIGKLFRTMQKEYGRCNSKMYIDTKSGGTKQVGWVFTKKMEYDDYRGRGDRYYIREVWVEVRELVREAEYKRPF
jgi:hypothetical protein